METLWRETTLTKVSQLFTLVRGSYNLFTKEHPLLEETKYFKLQHENFFHNTPLKAKLVVLFATNRH